MSHGSAVAAGPPAELVAEHAGREAVEVYGPPARLAEVEAAASAAGLPHAPHGHERLRARRRGRRRRRARRASGGRRTSRTCSSCSPGSRSTDGRRDAAIRAASGASSGRRSPACSCARSSTSRRTGARRPSRRPSSRPSTCSRSASASARCVSDGRRLRLRRVRRHRHGRDGGALLERVPGHVRDVRQVPVPAHVRRDPGRAGRHRGARDAPRRSGSRPAPASTAACRCSSRCSSGSTPAWGMLAVPFIGFLAGFGWAGFGIAVAGFAKSIENFSYIISAVLTPLFLVAGTFFPITQLPEWAQFLALFNPLYHCVELVRHAAFGFEGWDDLGHLAAIIAFGIGTWRVAIQRDGQEARRLMTALQGRLGPLVERDFRLLFAATTITDAGRPARVRRARVRRARPARRRRDRHRSRDRRATGHADARAALGRRALGPAAAQPRAGRRVARAGGRAGRHGDAAADRPRDGAPADGSRGALRRRRWAGRARPRWGSCPRRSSAGRLQQANALQGLSRNITGVIGPALGGLLVVLGSPGAALAFDAASFLLCAVLLAASRCRAALPSDEPSFLHELREGCAGVRRAARWLSASVVLCGISNMVEMSWTVLGPALSESHYGGAGTWAFVLSSGGAGAIVGGLVALRIRPSRPFLVSLACTAPIALQLAALAAQVPAPAAGGGQLRLGGGTLDPSHPLVHRLPARGARARAVARQLLRRARLVRALAARRRAGRAGGGRVRRIRDALGCGRDQLRLHRDPGLAAVRARDPRARRRRRRSPASSA